MSTHYLGPETDDGIFERLRTTVTELGGSIEDSEWVIGRSQDVTTYKVLLPTGGLEAVAETYAGLSLVGEETMIATIVKHMIGD